MEMAWRGRARIRGRNISLSDNSKLRDRIKYNYDADAKILCNYGLLDIALLSQGHFHLDRSDVIRRAAKYGVSRIVSFGMDMKTNRETMMYTKEYPNQVLASVGIHPHKSSMWKESMYHELRELALSPSCIAIGECGLDYKRNYSSQECQLVAFRRQLDLGIELQKPMLIHMRNSHQEVVEELNSRNNLPHILIHCFTGEPIEALTYLAMGFYIGVSGTIFTIAEGLQNLLRSDELPLDRIILETDAPYMHMDIEKNKLPKEMEFSILAHECAKECQFVSNSNHGKRTEPAMQLLLLEAVAALVGKSPEEIAMICRQNSIRFFNLPLE